MEFLIVILLLSLFVLAPVIGAIALTASFKSSKQSKPSSSKSAELKVTAALRSLGLKSYVVFENLILPSEGNTARTEIDHVVVSPYGIFCIETKSHSGSIYRFSGTKEWTQYLGSKSYKINNPLKQNYKHVKALEQLFGTRIKAPIHSYVVFPNAYKLTIDSNTVKMDIFELTSKISKHQKQICSLRACEYILKTLAYESSKKSDLSPLHIREVQSYLHSISA